MAMKIKYFIFSLCVTCALSQMRERARARASEREREREGGGRESVTANIRHNSCTLRTFFCAINVKF